MLSQNPQFSKYARNAEGVKYLFKVVDKQRTEALKRGAGRALETIFGEPLSEEEITRLKTLVKGSSTITDTQLKKGLGNAYMPDTSTRTRKKSDAESNVDAEIKEAVEKGDVDATIDAVFKRALA
jgi:hypothetical protein